jgi:hypothetical protein
MRQGGCVCGEEGAHAAEVRPREARRDLRSSHTLAGRALRAGSRPGDHPAGGGPSHTRAAPPANSAGWDDRHPPTPGPGPPHPAPLRTASRASIWGKRPAGGTNDPHRPPVRRGPARRGSSPSAASSTAGHSLRSRTSSPSCPRRRREESHRHRGTSLRHVRERPRSSLVAAAPPRPAHRGRVAAPRRPTSLRPAREEGSPSGNEPQPMRRGWRNLRCHLWVLTDR